MATLAITKVSGVLFFQQNSNTNPKSYFGATGKYQASDDNLTLLIQITDQSQSAPDLYTIPYGSLTIGGTLCTTMSQAKTMLNGIFGT